jgi:hypothetical protein
VRALLCPLFSRSTWSRPATVVAGMTVDCAALASVRSVGVGSANHCMADTTGEGPALASVRWVGEGSTSHCVGEHGM